MRNVIWILLIGTFNFMSCIDEIDIPLSSESILTINGLITDEQGVHIINLSHSYSFNDNPTFVTLSPLVFGAQIEISDDLGNTFEVNEGTNGNYLTLATFVGEIGRVYTLKVTLNNGEVFYSKPEKMEPIGAAIEEVCFENSIKEISTGESIREENEVSFTVNFKDDPTLNSYYRWGYQSVHQVESPLADTSPPCDPLGPSGKCGPCSVPTKTCWASTFDSEFLKVDNDQLFNGKSVKDYTIYSTSADRKFDIMYAAHIEQYSLTETAYEYWNAISAQLGNVGTIFEAPNYQIRGNIYSEENPERLVLGFFGASAKTTTMTLVGDIDIPGNVGPIDCTPSPAGCIPASCIDCRAWPATNIKPSYWPN